MNESNTANAYLRTKVMTASPEELRLMLLDGAVKFAYLARAGLEQAHPEMIYLGFTQCRDIVLELLNTIKTEPAPEIAQSVRELYTFMYSELIKASNDQDINKLNEIIGLLEYDRETWVLTMEQLVKEREAGMVIPAAAPVPARQPISFQA
ncbi:MAG: flagellar export chaperone FliS [Phycisphaerales bacterium]|nr:flagellar export chaperone FliS [Phycisphaerales bacterium]